METVDPILYSRRLAASALSLSVSSIDYLIKNGRLKTVRVGAKKLIPRSEIFALAKRGLPSAVSGL
jgi:excisionase family DNA binding protein